jgi:hypothetical protein
VRKGSTGTLILTTQRRRISTPRGLANTEEYDTVFREEVKPGAKSGIPKRDEAPAGLPWRCTITPGPVNLFRFSALTGNPHRIHYDRVYAMEVEGYPGLVGTHRSRRSASPTSSATTIQGVRSTPSACAPGPPVPHDLVGRATDGAAACQVWAFPPGAPSPWRPAPRSLDLPSQTRNDSMPTPLRASAPGHHVNRATSTGCPRLRRMLAFEREHRCFCPAAQTFLHGGLPGEGAPALYVSACDTTL